MACKSQMRPVKIRLPMLKNRCLVFPSFLLLAINILSIIGPIFNMILCLLKINCWPKYKMC